MGREALDERWGGPKVTRASVTQTVSGNIQGEARLEYLMTYCNDGSATYLVTLRVAGELDGRSGSVVAEGKGGYAAGSATCNFAVVPGAGIR